MSFLYQFLNLTLIFIALGVPIVIAVILLKRFGKEPNSNEDYLLEKIRELENRIKALENEIL